MTYAGHGTRTTRDSLHVIATSNPQDLDTVVTRWIAVADKARADADLVRSRLSSLVTAGGWTGPGADTYARAVDHEVVEPLLAIETTARAMATSLLGVQQKVEDATASAVASPIPWDFDTAWHVTQQQVDISGYVVGTAVDGILYVDETATVTAYNAAQEAADYDITTGSGRVVKTITAASWAATQRQSTPMPAAYHGTVAAEVHRFDVWMEYQALNADAHAAVSTAADRVEVALIDFLAVPSSATRPTYGSAPTGLGTGSASTATTPGEPAGAYASGDTAPGAATTRTEPAVAGGSSWMPPGTGAASAGVGGVGAVATGSGRVAAGGFSSVAGSVSGLSFGAPPTPAGTTAASAGGGMPAVMPAGFGGMGAPGQKTGKGDLLRVPGGSGTDAGIAGLGSNPSFRMGSTGRGTAGTGSAGGVEANLPLGSLMGGQVLMGARNVRKKDDSADVSVETWLEEDQDVWGTAASRTDG